jgi:adenosylhomocysteine nucleosidase
MPGEARPLLRLVGESRAGRIAGRKAWYFQTGTSRCVLILSGMGLEPARKAARALVEAESPRAILSFGIAGALNAGLAIGDIVAGERCLMWENAALGDACLLADLPEAARQAASAAARTLGARYLRGTIVTVRGIQAVPALARGISVVEMETCAIAGAAAQQGVPLFSLRSISDSPEEPIPFTMAGGEDFHLQPLALLWAILRDPRIIRSLARLKSNSAKAARNLAEVVFAILCQSDIALQRQPPARCVEKL